MFTESEPEPESESESESEVFPESESDPESVSESEPESAPVSEPGLLASELESVSSKFAGLSSESDMLSLVMPSFSAISSGVS